MQRGSRERAVPPADLRFRCTLDTMAQMIYLDHNATTPILPEVLDTIIATVPKFVDVCGINDASGRNCGQAIPCQGTGVVVSGNHPDTKASLTPRHSSFFR